MCYDLHLSTGRQRLKERLRWGKEEGRALLLRHRPLEPGGTMKGLESVGGWNGRRISAVGDPDASPPTLRLHSLPDNLLPAFHP